MSYPYLWSCVCLPAFPVAPATWNRWLKVYNVSEFHEKLKQLSIN